MLTGGGVHGMCEQRKKGKERKENHDALRASPAVLGM
jgi:hypothetical protein